MRAFVFSIGESTTELCVEQLEKFGFDVVLWQDSTPLWKKLYKLYWQPDEEIVRVDADIIPNENILELINIDDDCWWHCASGWDLYKNDIAPISIHYMKQEALVAARDYISRGKDELRPETYVWRSRPFMQPRRCEVVPLVCGIHGYGQKDQAERIKTMKSLRNQPYDWDFIEKMQDIL